MRQVCRAMSHNCLCVQWKCLNAVYQFIHKDVSTTRYSLQRVFYLSARCHLLFPVSVAALSTCEQWTPLLGWRVLRIAPHGFYTVCRTWEDIMLVPDLCPIAKFLFVNDATYSQINEHGIACYSPFLWCKRECSFSYKVNLFQNHITHFVVQR